MARNDAIVELITTISETPAEYLPPKLARAQKEFLEAGPRSDSAKEQIELVLELARMAGCYDAIDTIRGATMALSKVA